MILARQHLMLLLNALYDLETETVTIEHPSDGIGELLRIRLDDPRNSEVSVSTGRYTYQENREEVLHEYGEIPYEDLPDPQTYVRTLTASGVFEIANQAEIQTFLDQHGYPDLQAGHTPVLAGIDTNVFPWRIQDVLDIDPELDQYDGSGSTPPVTGYALATGVEEELTWHYEHFDTHDLTQAFGDSFERLQNAPAGQNREGLLGLYEFRKLRAERHTERIETATGDDAILDGYEQFEEDDPRSVVLFSNDTGFVDGATDRGLLAKKIAYPPDIPAQTTASWEEICTLLSVMAVVFGVLELPKATLYGAWNGKNGRHWAQEQVAIDCRSPKLETELDRQQDILSAYESE